MGLTALLSLATRAWGVLKGYQKWLTVGGYVVVFFGGYLTACHFHQVSQLKGQNAALTDRLSQQKLALAQFDNALKSSQQLSQAYAERLSQQQADFVKQQENLNVLLERQADQRCLPDDVVRLLNHAIEQTRTAPLAASPRSARPATLPAVRPFTQRQSSHPSKMD